MKRTLLLAFMTVSMTVSAQTDLIPPQLPMQPVGSPLFQSEYTVPMAARGLSGATTLPEDNGPRRIIGSGEDYRPGYDPGDPFFTPVGTTPWLLMLLMGMIYVVNAARREHHDVRSKKTPD